MNTETLIQPAPQTRTSVIDIQGIPATSFDDTLKACNLDWEPKEDGVAGQDTGITVPRRKLLYRSDNDGFLGIVGKDYKATSPREFVQTQYEFAEFCQGRVARVGFVPERSKAFSFVQLAKGITVPKGLSKVGDTLSAYIYSSDGWDGCTPRTSRLYIERLVCSNGMTSKELTTDIWISHTKNSDQRYTVQWKAFLTEVSSVVTRLTTQFTALANERMNETQAKAFLAKLVPAETKPAEAQRIALLDLFKNGKGNAGVSRWDAYNAVTEFVTHHRTYRETEATSSDTNRFLGILETDTLRNRAYTLLVSN